VAVRYVPKQKAGVFLVDRSGKKRFFKGQRRLPDGTLGYKPDEIKGLSRDAMKAFRKVEVSGSDIIEDETVEQATAAPGEKRAVSRGKKTDSDDE
jgi:hypothetical protein